MTEKIAADAEKPGIVVSALKVRLLFSIRFPSVHILTDKSAALATYEPHIGVKVDQLISHVEKNLGQTIDISTWAMFLAFDIMGTVGFGKEFNNLATGVEHPGIKAIHDHMAILGVLNHIPWLLNLAGRIPGAAASLAEFFKWCEDEIVQKQKVCYHLTPLMEVTY